MACDLVVVQGENNRACWPVVMQNGVVQMAVLSDIEFSSHQTDENGIKRISVSAHDPNKVELAKISVRVDQNGVAQDQVELVCSRDFVKQEVLFHQFQNTISCRARDNQIIMDPSFYEKAPDTNESLASQDPLQGFKYQEERFSIQNTLTHMLLVFIHLCQNQAADQSPERMTDDVFTERVNSSRPTRDNVFSFPYAAWFETRAFSS